MNTKIKSVLAAASVLALSALAANAQLLLVSTNSTFLNVQPASTNVNIINGGLNTVSSIEFSETGYNATFKLTATPQQVAGLNVLAPAGGNIFDNWKIDYTALGAQNALVNSFDFAFDFDFQGGDPTTDLSLLFRVSLTYDLTDNGVPRINYTTASITPIKTTFFVDSVLYRYEVNATNGLSGSVVSGSGNSVGSGNLDIAFSKVVVPEPSTYALFGVVGLMGLVAVRRFRSSKKVA